MRHSTIMPDVLDEMPADLPEHVMVKHIPPKTVAWRCPAFLCGSDYPDWVKQHDPTGCVWRRVQLAFQTGWTQDQFRPRNTDDDKHDT